MTMPVCLFVCLRECCIVLADSWHIHAVNFVQYFYMLCSDIPVISDTVGLATGWVMQSVHRLLQACSEVEQLGLEHISG